MKGKTKILFVIAGEKHKIERSSHYNFQPHTQQDMAQNVIYIFPINETERFFEKLSNEQQLSII